VIFLRSILILLVFFVILTSFIPIFDILADDAFLPEWIFTLSEWWRSDNIGDLEFTNALKYLQEQNIIKLTMDTHYDIITNFLITEQLNKNESIPFSNCSSDWYITGYFTPVESDYSASAKEIIVENTTRNFKSDFLDDMIIEGWGKTQSGDYLGWYDGSFHLSDNALDLYGNNLLVNAVAVDSSIIKQKTKLNIQTLPAPWNKIIFTASDVGPAIIGKHIDVYTGEGKQAESETFRITGEFNKVCTD